MKFFSTIFLPVVIVGLHIYNIRLKGLQARIHNPDNLHQTSAYEYNFKNKVTETKLKFCQIFLE